MERKLLLQLFGEEAEETPTQDVENSDNESEEQDDDVEFDDDNDLEETKKEESKKETSKQQRQNNYNNAQARLQRKHKEEVEKAKRDSYVKGVVESNGGKNRFTGATIQDEFDVNQLEMLNEMEKQGLDTDDVGEILKFMANKEREANKQKMAQLEAEEKQSELINRDMQDFIDLYGEDKLEEILDEDSEFSKSKYSKLINKLGLKDAYDLYADHVKEIDTKANTLLKQKDARRKASSGGLGKQQTQEISYENMTYEERKAYRDSIRSR